MKCSIRVGLLAATLLIGCSDETEPVPDAAPRPDAPTIVDAGRAVDVSVDVPPTDVFINLFDVFPLPDGGCPGCIRDRCGSQINSCFNNPACTLGLFCTLQMCAGGLIGEGGFNPSGFACVLGCFNGDQNLAMMAIGSFTCLTMTCGSACNFLDAGANPDVQTRPDASADAAEDASADISPEDASDDTVLPETGPDADASEDTGEDTGDDSAPADGAADATAEPLDPPDSGSPIDVTPDTDPPSDDGSAE
jgi:hypothetical protein